MSSSPLVRYADSTLVLPLRLFGSVGYYAAMAAYGHVVVDATARFDKRQKSVHRYDIVDTRQRLALTVPIIKPHGCDHAPTWDDARISRHNEWWRLHITALESAYGRTPFFEFIIDRFASLFTDPGESDVAESVLSFDRRADAIVRDILGIDADVHCTSARDFTAEITKNAARRIVDMRPADFYTPEMKPYWQVRADRLGFQPSLSILDLIFNLGPEAPVYLRGMRI